MGTKRIPRYRCKTCPFRAVHLNPASKRVQGAYLKYGMNYCTAGKKAHIFKPNDPKVYPPSWCPRLKRPAEYRVYAFKDTNAWFLNYSFKYMGESLTPSGSAYAVRVQGHTSLTAREFQDATKNAFVEDILGIRVSEDEIIEIDDGLQPSFFLNTQKGMKVLDYFDREAAWKNKYMTHRTPETGCCET